jgi:hypothetical protein
MKTGWKFDFLAGRDQEKLVDAGGTLNQMVWKNPAALESAPTKWCIGARLSWERKRLKPCRLHR